MKCWHPLIASLLFASPAGAEGPYRWTDRQGVVHFTDDPEEAAKHHAKATSGDEITVLPSNHPQTEKDAATRTDKDDPPPQRDPTESERFWRNQFKQAYERIAMLEHAIEADRALVEDSSGYSKPKGTVSYNRGQRLLVLDPEYEATRQRLHRNQKELKRARQALEDLERKASEQLVPREWRR